MRVACKICPHIRLYSQVSPLIRLRRTPDGGREGVREGVIKDGGRVGGRQ